MYIFLKRVALVLSVLCIAAQPIMAAAQTDVIAQGLNAHTRQVLAAAVIQASRPSRGLVPVCNNVAMPTGTGTGTSFQYQSRTVLYCPDGVASVRFTFAGNYVSGNTESDNAGPVQIKASYEVAPAPWSASTIYAIGDKVSWYPTFTNTSSDPLYVAVASNSASAPNGNNSNWTSTAKVPLPLSFSGSRFGLIPGVTTTAGTTVSGGWLESDQVLPGPACAVSCYIAVNVYATASNGVAVGLGQHFAAGSAYAATSSQTDITDTTAWGTPQSAIGSSLRPVLASGIPARNASNPTFCVIGDSRATGATGFGVQATGWSISSGGTGYVASDIGKLVTMGRTGATSGAVGDDAKWVIMQVSAGAVTSERLAETGTYSNVTSMPSQTLPTGTQTLTGSTTGTGLALTGITYGATGGGYDPGDATYAQGYIARGLSAAGARYALFVSPGDTQIGTAPAGWNNRRYSRMALIAKSGCTDVIYELGVNALTAGSTAAQIEAVDTTIAYELKGLGVSRVWTTTVSPYPTSTDGYVTLGNQTAGVQNAATQALNAFRRASALPFDGVFDEAAVIEHGAASSPDGLVVVTGAACPYMCDAKHYTQGGHALLAPAFTAKAAAIIAIYR